MTTAGAFVGGRYRLGEPVGDGGMSHVWAARDEVLDREVAVKIGHADADVAERIRREGPLAARVRHPNVVEVLDAGTEGDRAFVVMERLSGRTLRDELADGRPLDHHELCELARDVLAGLGAVHAAGIVHRDIKPSNILEGDRGEWKLADFGIAKSIDGPGDDLTRTGLVIGTQGYIAPERLRGAPATVASDLYAAAAVLHEAAVGRGGASAPPGEVATEVMEPTSSPDASERFVAALAPALSAAPERRYGTASEMAAALGVGLDPAVAQASTRVMPVAPAPRSRKPVLAGAAAVAVLGLGAAVAQSDGGGLMSPVPPDRSIPSTTAPPTTTTTAAPPATSIVVVEVPVERGDKGKPDERRADERKDERKADEGAGKGPKGGKKDE